MSRPSGPRIYAIDGCECPIGTIIDENSNKCIPKWMSWNYVVYVYMCFVIAIYTYMYIAIYR